jgi:hypothetical protein
MVNGSSDYAVETAEVMCSPLRNDILTRFLTALEKAVAAYRKLLFRIVGFHIKIGTESLMYSAGHCIICAKIMILGGS